MFSAKTFEEFLTVEECDILLNYAINTKEWENGGSDFWDNRVLRPTSFLKDSKELLLFQNIHSRIADLIKKEYALEKVNSDEMSIVRWFPEMEQPPHCDDMSNTDIQGFSHRNFGVIIYLNDDYDGGETFYPQYNFYIKPVKGKIAIHPGDSDHLHGVTKIKNSIRYTIASFWSKDKDVRVHGLYK
jgi:hypothetical protein